MAGFLGELHRLVADYNCGGTQLGIASGKKLTLQV
jgi:hypothetical protein